MLALAGRFGCARSSGSVLSRSLVSVGMTLEVDPEYPGTAVARMRTAREREVSLSSAEMNGGWEAVRSRVLWAAGLRDIKDAAPGSGYTGHAFNDGSVKGIAVGNQLGPGIEVASLPELGTGGSWSTCTNGCNLEPPQDVAHVQFRSRIAFKLVWVPPALETFVLVDDAGDLLNSGTPTGRLPALSQRQQNFALVRGSKYAAAAEALGKAA